MTSTPKLLKVKNSLTKMLAVTGGVLLIASSAFAQSSGGSNLQTYEYTLTPLALAEQAGVATTLTLSILETLNGQDSENYARGALKFAAPLALVSGSEAGTCAPGSATITGANSLEFTAPMKSGAQCNLTVQVTWPLYAKALCGPDSKVAIVSNLQTDPNDYTQIATPVASFQCTSEPFALIPGPKGEPGADGKAGADGAPGAQGPAGPAGACCTKNSLLAN